MIKLRELVRSPHNRDLEIHLRQADPESYRAVLKEIKTKEIHNIVIDTKASNMPHFLKGVSPHNKLLAEKCRINILCLTSFFVEKLEFEHWFYIIVVIDLLFSLGTIYFDYLSFLFLSFSPIKLVYFIFDLFCYNFGHSRYCKTTTFSIV